MIIHVKIGMCRVFGDDDIDYTGTAVFTYTLYPDISSILDYGLHERTVEHICAEYLILCVDHKLTVELIKI